MNNPNFYVFQCAIWVNGKSEIALKSVEMVSEKSTGNGLQKSYMPESRVPRLKAKQLRKRATTVFAHVRNYPEILL